MLACALAAGCASTPAQVVIGPARYDGLEQLWEATVATLAAAGYTPEASDPYRGRMLLPSRMYGSRHRFTVQCYREGWVQLGYEDSRDAHQPALAREHLALALALRERLHDRPAPEPTP